MKKRNTRSTLLVLLVCASISSAVYLSIVSSDVDTANLPEIEVPSTEDFEEQERKSLPDVDLLKKVLGATNKALAIVNR